MGQTYAAPAPDQGYRPAFVVQKLDGHRTIVKKRIKAVDVGNGKKRNEYEDYEEKVPNGWLVSFRKGHSIHVESESEMKRLGFDKGVPIVDDEGDVKAVLPSNVALPTEEKRPGTGATQSK